MQDVYGPALGFLSEQAGTALLSAGAPGDRCRVWELLASASGGCPGRRQSPATLAELALSRLAAPLQFKR